IVLSVACPGVAGAGLVCMSLMLSQFAVPTEALAVFIGYYVISDPFFTANNILGDFAGTYTIAKRNNLMVK
nr:dicarboxylate/amino acid:cation symporter [Parasporobacterium sp.]